MRLIVYLFAFVFFLASFRAATEMQLGVSRIFSCVCMGCLIGIVVCNEFKYLFRKIDLIQNKLKINSFVLLIFLVVISVLIGWIENYMVNVQID